MNLVKLITDQFSDETLGKLSGLLGTDSETTSAAATAAVPSLLSGLAGLASRTDGAKKLTDVLSGIDAGSLGNLAQLLGGDTGGVQQRGNSLLGSLFGDGITSGIASAISRYSGINFDMAKRLLAFLMPMVLGKVAGQWRSQGGTVSALTNMFADQKRHIADAVPAGFSLADIPGLANVGDAARTATQTTRRAAETAGAASSSVASWLLPLAVLLVGGFLLWNFLKPRPAENPPVGQVDTEAAKTTVMKPVTDAPRTTADETTMALPDATRMTEDLRGIFTSVTDQLGSIRDAASGEAALPKLEEIKTKLDGFQAMWARLPETSQTTIRPVINEQLDTVREQAERTAATPGLSDRVKSIINEIIRILSALASPAPQQ